MVLENGVAVLDQHCGPVGRRRRAGDLRELYLIELEPSRAGRHRHGEYAGVQDVVKPCGRARSRVVDHQVIDLDRVVGVRIIVQAEPEGSWAVRIGVDEQRALDVEIEATDRVFRRAAAALHRHRALTRRGRIDYGSVGDDLEAHWGERRAIDHPFAGGPLGTGWQPERHVGVHRGRRRALEIGIAAGVDPAGRIAVCVRRRTDRSENSEPTQSVPHPYNLYE